MNRNRKSFIALKFIVAVFFDVTFDCHFNLFIFGKMGNTASRRIYN